MKKHDGWITALYTLVFIAIPCIVGIFFLIDMDTNRPLVWGIGASILGGTNLLTYIAYKVKLLAIDAFTFVFPISVVFFGIYGTMYENWWLMLIVAIIGVLTSLPTNMVVTNQKDKQLAKLKEEAKKQANKNKK